MVQQFCSRIRVHIKNGEISFTLINEFFCIHIFQYLLTHFTVSDLLSVILNVCSGATTRYKTVKLLPKCVTFTNGPNQKLLKRKLHRDVIVIGTYYFELFFKPASQKSVQFSRSHTLASACHVGCSGRSISCWSVS